MQNSVIEAENFNADSVAERGEGHELDPKSARKEAINDMKREHIMNAALKVIARDGYANSRLEDIAEEAGFSKASIYHYFPDKEALFIHIIIREQKATYEKCVEVIGRGLPFRETLREFIVAIFDRFFGSGKFYEQYIGGVPSMSIVSSFMSSFVVSMTKHEELFTLSTECKNRTNGLMMQIIARAKRDGVLTIPVEDEILSCFITSFFQTFIMQSLENLYRSGWHDKVFKVNFNKAVDSLFIFLEPWIREKVPHTRREHAHVS